jgi:hypothetical protein
VSIRINPRLQSAFLGFFLVLPMLGAPARTSAAPAGAHGQNSADGLDLPTNAGWSDWQAVREQRAKHAMVKVFVPRGQAPATAKVRLVVTRMTKPSFDSPQGILDATLNTARHQCKTVKATTVRKRPEELIFELRGIGCAGQTGERYLLQRIAFVGQSELQVTYAPMTPTDDLPPAEKRRALKLLSSVRIATDSASSEPKAETGWFLITPPREPDGQYNGSAPISKWKIQEGAGSRDKCERLRTILASVAAKQGHPGDAEQVKAARCIAMDDPRLDNE